MDRVSIRRILVHDGLALWLAGIGGLLLFHAVVGLLSFAGFLPPFHERDGRVLSQHELTVLSVICAIMTLILLVLLSLRIWRIRTTILNGIHARAKVTSIEKNKSVRIHLSFLDDRKGQTAEVLIMTNKDVRAIEPGSIVEVAFNTNNPKYVLIVGLYTVPRIAMCRNASPIPRRD